MTQKEMVALSLLLADTKADRRLGIPRSTKLAAPQPPPSTPPAPVVHEYVLPTVIPATRKNPTSEEWCW